MVGIWEDEAAQHPFLIEFRTIGEYNNYLASKRLFMDRAAKHPPAPGYLHIQYYLSNRNE